MGEQSEPIKVLLIEDNYQYAKTIEKILLKEKTVLFEIKYADALSDGLETIEDQNIDLILLDLMLPDSEGIETFVKVNEKAP